MIISLMSHSDTFQQLRGKGGVRGSKPDDIAMTVLVLNIVNELTLFACILSICMCSELSEPIQIKHLADDYNPAWGELF